MLFDAHASLDPVHAWHDYIAQDYVGSETRSSGNRRLPIVSSKTFVTVAAQNLSQCLRNHLLVIYYEDFDPRRAGNRLLDAGFPRNGQIDQSRARHFRNWNRLDGHLECLSFLPHMNLQLQG